MKVESLGRPAHFFLPSQKWDDNTITFRGKTVKVLVHEFLIANYNGYTVRGPYEGTWRPNKNVNYYREPVMEVKCSFRGKDRIPKLQKFLAGMCKLMNEECLYMETGEDSWLVYP